MPNRAFLKSRTTYIYIYKYKRIIIRPNERVRRLYGAFLNIRDLTIRELLYIYIYIYMEATIVQGGQGLKPGRRD